MTTLLYNPVSEMDTKNFSLLDWGCDKAGSVSYKRKLTSYNVLDPELNHKLLVALVLSYTRESYWRHPPTTRISHGQPTQVPSNQLCTLAGR